MLHACLQAGHRIAEGMGASASGAAGRLGELSGDFSGLRDLEPHYGTHAAQRAAESLLQWLRAQSLGPLSLGSLGGSASLELREQL
jgi:hypothetical protein